MSKLAELCIKAEIDDTNPFEVACWRAVERIYYQHERVWTPHDLAAGRQLPWLQAMQKVRVAYEELTPAPTQALLDKLNKLLDAAEAL